MSLFPTILLVMGKANFTNLSRYSEWPEKTYRRQYSQAFNFMGLNAQLIGEVVPAGVTQIGAIDCSFIAKSGKATYGLDWFYNGSRNRTEKGLEVSVIAVIDVTARQGYSLSVQQTPATNPGSRLKRKARRLLGRRLSKCSRWCNSYPQTLRFLPA